MKFYLKSFPYINEPTDYQLEVETPDKYFVPTTADVRKDIRRSGTCITIQEENSWEYHCGSIQTFQYYGNF